MASHISKTVDTLHRLRETADSCTSGDSHQPRGVLSTPRTRLDGEGRGSWPLTELHEALADIGRPALGRRKYDGRNWDPRILSEKNLGDLVFPKQNIILHNPFKFAR